MSIFDVFTRKQRSQPEGLEGLEGLEEFLRMMDGNKPSKPAKPGKVSITKIEVPADFVTQLIETGLEQFGIMDAIKANAEEQIEKQVERIRSDAQRQVDDALERLQQERREMRSKERSKSMIEMEVREFVNGQIYPFQVTHQALAEYTGRHTDQFDSFHPEIKSYVRRYRDGNPHRCGDPDCTADKITQTLDYYVELERLAQSLMADMMSAQTDDEPTEPVAEQPVTDAGDNEPTEPMAEQPVTDEGENEAEPTEPVAEKAAD